MKRPVRYDQAGIIERLRRARERQGMSMREVAKCAGISAASICRMETNLGTMRLDSFVRLCGALGISPSVALGER